MRIYAVCIREWSIPIVKINILDVTETRNKMDASQNYIMVRKRFEEPVEFIDPGKLTDAEKDLINLSFELYDKEALQNSSSKKHPDAVATFEFKIKFGD